MFKDRREAGRELANVLARHYRGRHDVLVLGLPRGGVILAHEVAKRLELSINILVVRKLGAPGNPEYAIGALAETGDVIWNEGERAMLSERAQRRLIDAERHEAERRARLYRGGREAPDLHGKTALLVDDGVATGYTMRAAVTAARNLGADNVVVAVPHGAFDTLQTLRLTADSVIALIEPIFYGSVGAFYSEFPQVSDEEVLAALANTLDLHG
ncbi:MAG: phosphoribosyltransferase family protein [Candidatus Uhrbacteria bacterium]|nr:phosphoribosyltransferase family protein [Candidatus Uhrbacteria bacterium]